MKWLQILLISQVVFSGAANSQDSCFGDERYRIEKYVKKITAKEYHDNHANTSRYSYVPEKKDGTIVLHFDSGAKEKFNDNTNTDTDGYMVYEPLGFDPELRAYILGFQSFEGWGSLLVSAKDGKRIRLIDYPLISPSKNQVACVRTDEEGFVVGTIEVYTLDFDSPKMLLGLWSEIIFPSEGYWYDENTVFIKHFNSYENEIGYYSLNIEGYK